MGLFDSTDNGMYGGLFDFDHDGHLNMLEKSAEMDYFAEQSSNSAYIQILEALQKVVDDIEAQNRQPVITDEEFSGLIEQYGIEAITNAFNGDFSPIKTVIDSPNQAKIELEFSLEKIDNSEDSPEANQ